jgi:hypothetical protein
MADATVNTSTANSVVYTNSNVNLSISNVESNNFKYITSGGCANTRIALSNMILVNGTAIYDPAITAQSIIYGGYTNFATSETSDISWGKNFTANRVSVQTNVTIFGNDNATWIAYGKNNNTTSVVAQNFTGNWAVKLPDCSGELVAGNGTQTTGNALCWKTPTKIGQCVGGINASGNCTCQ